jgi:histone H3/H4
MIPAFYGRCIHLQLTILSLTNEHVSSEPTVDFPRGVDGFGPERTSLASRRESDVTRRIVLDDDSETTFVFTGPQRNAQTDRPLFQEPQTQSEEEVEDENEEEEAEESEIDQVDTVGDMNMEEAIVSELQKSVKERPNVPRVKKSIRVSRHGIPYSSLPPGVVKKLATTFLRTSGNSNAKISKDTLHAIIQASDWFFEQVSEDLGAYAHHANRKTIDDNDVITLMKR